MSPEQVNTKLKLELYVDKERHVILLYSMRLTSIMIVIAIALSILSPPVVVSLQAGPASPSIQTLDVCHRTGMGIHPDLPYIHECPCKPLSLRLAGVCAIYRTPCKPLLIIFQDERPPEFPR
jgi:hypothetical protein